MKFDESSLTEYLVKNLESLTEADPAILADYIVALLKKDKPIQELQKLCIDNLVEFLGHGTKSFVSEIFKTFEDVPIMTSDGIVSDTTKPESTLVTVDSVRSSSPREENPSISRQFSDSEEREVSDDEDDDRNHKHRRRENRPQPLEDSQGQFSRPPFRKRNRPNENGQQFVEREYNLFSGRDSSSSSDKRRPAPGDFGQKNRMGRGIRPNNSSRFDLSANLMRPPIGGRGRGTSSWNPLDSLGFAPQMPSLLGAGFSTAASAQSTSWGSYGFIPGLSNGCLDPLHPLNLQGGLHPSMNPVSVGMPRQRCRDFEERGFCLRGDMCPMEHGMNRIVVEDVQSLSQFNLPVSLPATSILGAQSVVGPMPTATSSNLSSNSKSAASKISKSGTTNTGLGIDGAISAPTLGPEADVYDPDQPLWNNDQPETSGTGLRLPSPNMEDVRALWESGLSDHNNFNLSSGMGNEQQNFSMGDHNLESLAPWGRGRSNNNFANMRRTSLGNGTKKEADSMSSQNIDKTANATDLDGERKLGKTSQKAQRTVFVSGIPQSNNRRETLVSHFHKFGEIIDIYIPVNSEKAFVQFSRREEAEAALKSPDAVMGNRFIKLWWANRDNIPDGPMKAQSTPVSNKLQTFIRDKGESKDSSMAQNPLKDVKKTSTIGGQKVIPQVQGKIENIESLKEELRKKQESLKQKRDEFKRQLEKLQKQALSTTKSEVVAEQPAKKPKTDESTEVTKVPIVRGQQEQEKAQEKLSSRDTVISPNSKFSATLVLPSPRSGKLPSHSPGFYANRFKIDNRPTGFRIISPLPDDLANADALRDHFSLFGELSGIDLNTSEPQPSALITFTTRSSAERAFSSGNSWKGHNLQFIWLAPQTHSKPAPNAGDISASKASKASSSEAPVSFGLGRIHSIVANGGGGDVEGTEKRESLVLVSLSSSLSTERGEDGAPLPDGLVDESCADVGSTE